MIKTTLFSTSMALRVLAVAGMSFGLSACSHATDPKPGDKNYPVENPHPTHYIEFTASIPPTLSVNFQVTYLANPAAGGPPDTEGTCVTKVGLSETAPFGVYLPLQLKREGDTYRGSIAVDRFLPGYCEWGVFALRYRETHDEGDEFEPIAIFSTTKSVASVGQLHLWCVRDNKSSSALHFEQCGIPISMQAFIKPGFENSIPEDQRRSYRVDTSPSIRSIQVTFHDINALPSAQAFIKP